MLDVMQLSASDCLSKVVQRHALLLSPASHRCVALRASTGATMQSIKGAPVEVAVSSVLWSTIFQPEYYHLQPPFLNVIMFSASLRTTLIALVAIATAASVSATPALSVQVTGPATVDGVENLKVVTIVTNTGDETLKLLNHPNGVMDTLPTDTFTITNDGGDSPDFIGVRASYSPELAALSTNPWAVTVIAPGTSVSFTHDREYLAPIMHG